MSNIVRTSNPRVSFACQTQTIPSQGESTCATTATFFVLRTPNHIFVDTVQSSPFHTIKPGVGDEGLIRSVSSCSSKCVEGVIAHPRLKN